MMAKEHTHKLAATTSNEFVDRQGRRPENVVVKNIEYDQQTY